MSSLSAIAKTWTCGYLARNSESNIYRVFFILDEGQIVVLFHGFQKKSQKTPKTEIEKAIRIRKEILKPIG